MSLPTDHLERVYAGVIGKVVGVYLGRPVEGWPREKILSDIGHIRYYVHQKYDHPLFKPGVRPLVVTDDDVSATFAFLRALDEHNGLELTPEHVGKTWLNNTVEDRSVFWWGGKGVSTEHTAYLNLERGIPGGLSGAIQTNGKTVAEQIGGEIFIDGFAMCAPGGIILQGAGNTDLAAKLAKCGASVSHDGEGVYGAIMWAVMEAEAFRSKDVEVLIETGLRYIPSDSLIARSVADIRAWAKKDCDWEKTRDRIEDKYGNHKFAGACHVVPNHSIKILSLVYGGHSFDEALHIIVTCGWDTDSNGGNVGCLLGIMHGLGGIDSGQDWRRPLADRANISSADGGYSINNCTRIAYDITNAGRRLAGQAALEAPKNGSQFHFSLPGGVQGFQIPLNQLQPDLAIVEQGNSPKGPALAIHLRGFSNGTDAVEVLTDTFMPDECLQASHYIMQACPLVYPGQKLKASICTGEHDTFDGEIKATLTLKSGHDKTDRSIKAPSCFLRKGGAEILEWTIPDAFDHRPIRQIGITLTTTSSKPIHTTVWLDYLRWTGSPNMVLARPSTSTWPGSEGEPWRRAFVNSATIYHPYMPHFTVSQNAGEGGIFQGCRDWCDYRVTASRFVNHTTGANGLVARMQGLNRWYGLFFKPGKIVLIKAFDAERIEIAAKEYEWALDAAYDIALEADGSVIRGFVDGVLVVEARDKRWANGGMGFVVTDGSASVEKFKINPAGN